ncbi:hypothetical protein ACL6C3_09720 [Capilliphycus salinus ALCB114379]|uniref:hypothetical protein n=1 Tax=Capilliphycus salinus TaxID=2768948 RepID=UPI0039A6B863
MVTLTDDEVALIKSILIAVRKIKVRDIDQALVMLSKGETAKTIQKRRVEK